MADIVVVAEAHVYHTSFYEEILINKAKAIRKDQIWILQETALLADFFSLGHDQKIISQLS